MSHTNDHRRAVESRPSLSRSARRPAGRRALACLVAACLLASLAPAGIAAAQEEPFDLQALLAFFSATGGDGWDRNDNWGSDLPLDRWHGVTADSTGRVVSLSLPSNGLFGQIPASIGILTSLEHLDLGDNDLYGQIPADVGDLVNLTHLDLQNNRLGRQIPPEIGNLANLEVLDL